MHQSLKSPQYSDILKQVFYSTVKQILKTTATPPHWNLETSVFHSCIVPVETGLVRLSCNCNNSIANLPFVSDIDGQNDIDSWGFTCEVWRQHFDVNTSLPFVSVTIFKTFSRSCLKVSLVICRKTLYTSADRCFYSNVLTWYNPKLCNQSTFI